MSERFYYTVSQMKTLATILFSLCLFGCVSAPPPGSLAAIKLAASKEQYQATYSTCMKSWDEWERERLGAGRNKIYGPGGIDQFSYCSGLARHKAQQIRRWHRRFNRVKLRLWRQFCVQGYYSNWVGFPVWLWHTLLRSFHSGTPNEQSNRTL